MSAEAALLANAGAEENATTAVRALNTVLKVLVLNNITTRTTFFSALCSRSVGPLEQQALNPQSEPVFWQQSG